MLGTSFLIQRLWIWIRRLFIPIFFLIALITSVFGDLPPSDISFSDQNLQGLNHPSKSLLPATTASTASTAKLDRALVVAPDGTISLMDISSKTVLWSFKSGPPIYSSYQALPDREGSKHGTSSLSDSFFIDLGQDDWELYMHVNDSTVVKLGFTAEEFIRRAPYVSSDAILLGTNNSTVFIVDAKSGSVIRTFVSAGSPYIVDPVPVRPTVDVDAVEQLIYITRTDYMLKYSSQKTGQVLWHLTFADIEASFQCQRIEKLFGRGYSEGNDLCLTNPLVYRIHDSSSLESMLVSTKLASFPSRGRSLSLPASEVKHQKFEGKMVPSLLRSWTEDPSIYALIAPMGSPFALQNVESKIVRALPHLGIEDPRIFALPEGEHVETTANRSSKYQSGSNLRFLVPLFVLLSSTVAGFLCLGNLGKRGKPNLQVQDPKVQGVTNKKKKPRKASINKSNISVEKKPRIVVNENSVSSGYLDSENIERKFELAFNFVDDVIDGRKVGKLLVSNKEIAKGSNGTIVLEGIHDGRPVAVKRLVQTHHDVALKEIQNLIASDQHPNIVRWYGVEFDQDFVYLALERCTCSLHELISSYSNCSRKQLNCKVQDCIHGRDSTVRLQCIMDECSACDLWKADGFPSPQLLKLMRDIVHGLAHLHELGIIHRDLKPQNVLIRKDRTLCAKVSDMGISRRLAGSDTSLTKQTTGYGSSGWQAPEQLLHERQTRGVDLFSLGCVLFFCITGGKHPFGDNLERDVNIVKNRKDLFLIETIPEAMDLISSLLDPNPKLRPKAVDILHHPLFWNSEMRLSFLRDASDRVELEDRENDSELLKALEGIGSVALNGKWDEKMESAFINDIGRYRRYKYDSVRDLLRVIRNKLNHYRELPKEIQGILGVVPEGFDNYFSIRFPKLLIEVYKVLYRNCAGEESFNKYFTNIYI